MTKYQVIQADCLEAMRELEPGSVDLIATDPPYYKVKGEAWDNQWSDPDAFIAWIGDLCQEWRRVLAPNGSLYVFAWPKMAARVEVEIARWFNVCNRLTWSKPAHSTKAEMFRKGDMRSFFPTSEAVIFAEQRHSDAIAKGEAGYVAACDDLRGFVFEPLRAYLDGERVRAGVDKVAVNVACGFSASPGGMASRHYFSRSQWWLPTEQHYEAMRDLFNAEADGHLRREYGHLRREYGHLRREYEDLRREYEDLRRPFNASADRPYTDVWTFPTVQAYPGKHPCEKPQAMLRHIIETSSRPGAHVLDCFAGGGSMGRAALKMGRRVTLIDSDPKWAARCREVCEAVENPGQPELFAGDTTAAA